MILPGFLILAFLLSKASLSEIITNLRDINLLYFLLGVFLFFPMIVCKSLRWSQILQSLHIKIRLTKIIQLSLLGFFMGVATPGQAGDFIKVWHLKKAKYSLKDSFLSIIADRSIDFMLFTVFALCGVFYFIHILSKKYIFIMFILFFLLISCCVVTWVFIMKRREILSHPFVIKLLQIFIKKEKIKQLINFKKISLESGFWLKLSVVSLLQKAVLFLRLYVLALSLNIHINFFVFAFIMSIVTLIQLIPITVEGIGLRDAAMVYFFHYLGYSEETALSLSFLMLFTRILNTLPGFFVWIKNPTGDIIKIKEELSEV